MPRYSLHRSACFLFSMAFLSAPALAEPLNISNWDGLERTDIHGQLN